MAEPFDMNQVFQQIQELGGKMKTVQETLRHRTAEATVGGGMVRAVVNGKLELVRIEIDPQAVDARDVEMLQDLVVAAVNEAQRRAQALVQEELQQATGLPLGALGGLLDEADFELLEQLSAALERNRQPEWVGIHELRSWFSGSFRHFDLHLSVPRYLSVEQAHRIGDKLESTILEQVGGGGDVVVHLDPCEARQCGSCTLEDCPVRASPLREPIRFGVEAITRKGLV